MFTGLALAGALLAGITPLSPDTVPSAGVTASAPARYAGLTSCAGNHGKRHICGPWRLWLRDGKTLGLNDAQVRSLDAAGREQTLRAPIAVDPSGRYVAYYTRSNHRLVVRSLASGKITPVPGTAGRGRQMSQLALMVSPSGRYLVVDPEHGTRSTSVIEVASGKTWALPDYAKVRGFSPDGRLISVVLDMEETAVYKPGGTTPSGGVTLVGWSALDSAGKTLAGVSGEGARAVVRFYATSNAMESRKPLRLKLPAKQDPRRLDWVSGDRLNLLTLNLPGSYVSRSVNTTTGKTHVTDKFTISGHTWDVHLAGE